MLCNATHLLTAALIYAQVHTNRMVHGGYPTVRLLQTNDVASAGLWKKGHAQLGRGAFKSICPSRRHSTIFVAKLATTVRGVSSRDDDEISDRQRRSSRNMASTSGRTANPIENADLHRGRAATKTPYNGRNRDRDVSPDASWSYAFASPTTKTRVTQSRPGNSKSPAPGLQCEHTQPPSACASLAWAGSRGLWGFYYNMQLHCKCCLAEQHLLM